MKVTSEVFIYHYKKKYYRHLQAFLCFCDLDFRSDSRTLCDSADTNGFSEEDLLNITFEACDVTGKGTGFSFSTKGANKSTFSKVHLSRAYRRSPGLHCGAVSPVHDAPKYRSGQAEQFTAHAGPGESGSAC